jgi:hypothetical protein
MAKSRKEILQELLDLENEKVEEVEGVMEPKVDEDVDKGESVEAVKVKKPRTPKQLEAFERAKAIRDANAKKRKEDAEMRAEQERKIIEEKLVKKAIALKKKQIKKQAILDSISDDDTPLEVIKKSIETGNPSRETKVSPTTPSLPPMPTIKFY